MIRPSQDFQQTHTSDNAVDANSTESTITPEKSDYGLLVGASKAMQALYEQMRQVADTRASVLLIGESGTGKELIARTLHMHSARRGRIFLPVNCGAVHDRLIEAELFGHEPGSFTGAVDRHIGYFEHASGGTLLLDEITEMPIDMQARLLRVLEAGAFQRIGGSESIKVDVRVIAATNRDPWAAVRDGQFREDLLYRLAVFPIRVPTLRERVGDVELLADRFLVELNRIKKTDKRLSEDSLERMRSHDWPGNVRELKNVLQRAFIMGEKFVHIASADLIAGLKGRHLKSGRLSIDMGLSLADAQREFILATVEYFQGDKRRSARVLGINLKTLYKRLGTYEAESAQSQYV